MHRRRQKIKKKYHIEEKNIIHKKGSFYFTHNEDKYDFENIKEDKIFLFLQFFVHQDERRNNEMKFCLKKNIDNKYIDKIYLLNERLYSKEELGIESNKIEQIIIKDRLTFKRAFEFMRELDSAYCILVNSDIFLDNSINNIKYGQISLAPKVQALLRYEYKEDLELEEMPLFGIRHDAQDTWVVHNKFLKNIDLSETNFHLGIGGCDNAITERLNRLNFLIYNEPYMIKTYHYHRDNVRNWQNKTRIVRPYLYPKPIIKKIIKNEETYRRIKREINNINNNNFFNPVDYFKLLNIKWQEPVITEKKFYEQNKYDSQCFSLPWADIIDRKINLNIIYETFKDVKIGNYTCCQHIYFRRLIPLLKRLNITILYSPHKVNGENNIDGIDILPCPLYAVNIEDKERNKYFEGIDFIKNERKLWYSFQGGYNNSYINDIRKKILNLEKKPYNYLIDSKGWHFEKAVYGGDESIITDKLESYNKLLINSRFSLCPCGSGPNSIRFWECLATGSIPVLLSDTLDLPKHNLWEESIVKIAEKDLDNIEEILEKISKEKEEKMRKNCIEIYNYFKENYKGEDKKIIIGID